MRYMFDFKKLYYLLSAIAILISEPVNAEINGLTIWKREYGGLTFAGIEAKYKNALIYKLYKKGYVIDDVTGNGDYAISGRYNGVDSTIFIQADKKTDKIKQIEVISNNYNNSKKLINDYNKFCRALNRESQEGFIVPLKSYLVCEPLKSNINILKLEKHDLSKFTKIYGQHLRHNEMAAILDDLQKHWDETKTNISNENASILNKLVLSGFMKNHYTRYTITLSFDRMFKEEYTVVKLTYSDNYDLFNEVYDKLMK